MKSRLNFSQLFFLFAMIIYAVSSEPTPDIIGVDEILIGSLLVLSFIRSGLIVLGLFFLQRRNYIEKIVYMIFVYMFIVPSMIGILKEGNNLGDYIRDIIPLLYLFLPIFIISLIKAEPELKIWYKIILLSVIFIGIIFSLRFYLYMKDYIEYIGTLIIHGDKTYIFASPTILFSSIFLTLLGIYNIYKFKFPNLLKGSIYIFGGLLSFVVFTAVIMRANILFFLASVMFFLLAIFIKSLREFRILPTIMILSIIFVFIVININNIEGIFNLILKKFQAVGTNQRIEEFKYILDLLKENSIDFLLGKGWGAVLYDNPTGGNTRYTHNIFSFLLFKTGIVGLFIFMIYLLYFAYSLALLFINIKQNFVYTILILSFCSTLMIGMFIQPLFKMLGFGLILSLITLTTKLKVS